MRAGGGTGSVEERQRRLAERRLLAALRRAHRREPLRPDFRVDAVIDAARSTAPGRSPGHRGSERLMLDDAALLEVVGSMAEGGKIVRSGRRIRLPDHVPAMDPQMRERVDSLLDGLRAAGPEPPRVEAVAARLGIPLGVIEQLRASGELLAAAPGIDYPRDSWERLRERLARVAASGPLTVGRVRDALHTSRRHAEALLALRRAEADRVRRSRRRGG